MEELTVEEIGLIKESLRYTQQSFENYQLYPSYEYKLQRINEVRELQAKLTKIGRQLRKERRDNENKN